ncbi:MAG: chorismate mutase [Nanoarchaeota archaeon]
MVEHKELDELRRKINLLDDRLNETLKKRVELIKEVGRYKKKNKMPIRNLDREEEIIQKAIRNNIPERLARKIYNTIFEEAVKIEEGD